MKYFQENEDLSTLRAGDVLLMEDGTEHTAVFDVKTWECGVGECSIDPLPCCRAVRCHVNPMFHLEQTKP